MEQLRMIFAISLSFLVFFVWNYFFAPKKEKIFEKDIVQEEVVKKNDTKKYTVSSSEAFALKKVSLQKADSKGKIRIESPLYSIDISKEGAVVSNFFLKKYKEKNSKDSSLKNIVDATKNLNFFHLNFAQDSIKNLRGAIFSSDVSYEKIDVFSKKKKLTLSWTSIDNIKIEKEFIFYPNSYLIDFNLKIINNSNQKIQDSIVLSLLNDVSSSKKRRVYGFEGAGAFIGKAFVPVKTKKIEKKNLFTGNMKWISYQSRYFMSAVILDKQKTASLKLFLSDDKEILESQLICNMPVIHPNTKQNHHFKFFVGPKSVSILKKAGYSLEKGVDFGFFDFLAKPLLLIMNFLYNLFHNYGIAIIVLTILIKLVFFPLGTKSYKSMNEMKKLQPILSEIRAKYKNDKKKMNEEIMAIHKTYKINPLGGCLPIVVQIPIFFALYRMLYEAIELRHAPFFGWITDLSAPDRLLNFPFSVPFMQEPYGIPVLTLLMGLSMFAQQKMTPTSGEPMQEKMMMIMPVVMTVVFINFSSGLVLYWLINNVLSIAQQYYVQKKN